MANYLSNMVICNKSFYEKYFFDSNPFWIKDLQKYDYIENMCNEFNKVLNEEI